VNSVNFRISNPCQTLLFLYNLEYYVFSPQKVILCISYWDFTDSWSASLSISRIFFRTFLNLQLSFLKSGLHVAWAKKNCFQGNTRYNSASINLARLFHDAQMVKEGQEYEMSYGHWVTAWWVPLATALPMVMRCIERWVGKQYTKRGK
jgi:hypothetical protein